MFLFKTLLHSGTFYKTGNSSGDDANAFVKCNHLRSLHACSSGVNWSSKGSWKEKNVFSGVVHFVSY